MSHHGFWDNNILRCLFVFIKDYLSLILDLVLLNDATDYSSQEHNWVFGIIPLTVNIYLANLYLVIIS